MDGEFHGEYRIWGGDIDPQAVRIARKNALRAEVEDVVHFETADATAFHRTAEKGRLVLNPPYGERLLDRESAAQLYQALARAVSRLAPGWQTHILTAFPGFEACWGRTADRRRKLYNGMVKCQFYSYLTPEGPAAEERPLEKARRKNERAINENSRKKAGTSGKRIETQK